LSGIRKTITSKQEIKSLFKTGKRFSQKDLKIILSNNSIGFTRFLFCSDRQIKTAVQRNRVKRILRAHVLDKDFKLPESSDVALVAGKEFSTLKYEERKHILHRLMRKINGE
jgi:ribonuclease P protein component